MLSQAKRRVKNEADEIVEVRQTSHLEFANPGHKPEKRDVMLRFG